MSKPTISLEQMPSQLTVRHLLIRVPFWEMVVGENMQKPAVELTHMPSRADFNAVKARAHDDCECTEEMKLMHKETRVTCKPCAARSLMNGIATLSEKL